MIHNLPDLPQLEGLSQVLAKLQSDSNITAAWLGGSLARGNADVYSDIDLRIAVNTEIFNLERLPEPLEPLERNAIFMRRRSFGEGTAWHYAMLPNGAIWDVLIYVDTRDPFIEFRNVIFARGEWRAKLLGGSDPSIDFPAASADATLNQLEGFWLDWSKHAKVLSRGTENVLWMGANLSRHALTRLKFISASGLDCGPTDRMTIHTLLPVAKALEGWSAERLSLEEMALEAARLGRELAVTLEFQYPETLEKVARR